MGICHDRPSEAHRSRFHYLQAALQASPFACMPTICHLRWHFRFDFGVGFGLFGEEVVGEGGDVGYIDGAVGVDVGDCFAVGF